MKSISIFVFLSLSALAPTAVECLKYHVASLSELALITKQGKQQWESLAEKVNLPRYGSCWKDAVSDLHIGCQFLSEELQSEIALRFTDCFMQMSGYDPMTCSQAKSVCLRNLSDRAFNAYTEFYTHTQSICYFLQSQAWQEEAQKTIQRLSDTSNLVTLQLEEAGQVQQMILGEQKESLMLQSQLLENGKTISTTLESSEEKISKIMNDVQESAIEQKKVLTDVFEKLTLLRSGVMGEISWINSVLFYVSSMIIGYLLTSMSSTKQARLYILMALSVNYFIERLIYSNATDHDTTDYSGKMLSSWVWLSRKTFVIVSIILLVYSAIAYCDYNIVNHRLLIEIKDQNKKILSIFEADCRVRQTYDEKIGTEMDFPQIHNRTHDNGHHNYYAGSGKVPKNYTVAALSHGQKGRASCDRLDQPSLNQSVNINMDDIDSTSLDNVSVISDRSSNGSTRSVKSPYNLRSSRNKL